MRIKNIKAFMVNIPFKKGFGISHSVRTDSESVFVRAELVDGTVGWGEGMPRKYVTGESQESALQVLDEGLFPLSLKWDVGSYDGLAKKLLSLDVKKNENAAFCAFELALLDAYGRHFGKNVSALLGGLKQGMVRYSGIVSLNHGYMHLFKMRLFGLRDIKVKAGDDRDLERLKRVRTLFPGSDIRVDANQAWSVHEAKKKIDEMSRFRVSHLEEPVKTIGEMNELSAISAVPLIADETMRSLDEARQLDRRITLDIRLSKCGGILRSYGIYRHAVENKVPCMLGCHAGESGVLSAAGRAFALCCPGLKYAEGSYGRFLLADDVTSDDVRFGFGGIGREIKGSGLGVGVEEGKVSLYSF